MWSTHAVKPQAFDSPLQMASLTVRGSKICRANTKADRAGKNLFLPTFSPSWADIRPSLWGCRISSSLQSSAVKCIRGSARCLRCPQWPQCQRDLLGLPSAHLSYSELSNCNVRGPENQLQATFVHCVTQLQIPTWETNTSTSFGLFFDQLYAQLTGLSLKSVWL